MKRKDLLTENWGKFIRSSVTTNKPSPAWNINSKLQGQFLNASENALKINPKVDYFNYYYYENVINPIIMIFTNLMIEI